MDYKHTVIIVQRTLPHYRERFFELLKERLSGAGISLKLIAGTPDANAAKATKSLGAGWLKFVKNKEFKFGSNRFCWQPCIRHLRNADLIIVEQASKLLINYLLFFRQMLKLDKLCIWGHGKNFKKSRSNKLGEMLKKFLSRRAHWWFAYNDRSATVVSSLRYPEQRITSVQNTIDIGSLIAEISKVNENQRQAIKRKYNIKGDNVCLYVGSMYKEKRLDYLISACRNLRKLIPNFEMVFIGTGPDVGKIEVAANHYSWLHHVGPKYGVEKVPFFMLSNLLLMPGLVGLAIVDAFALKTPLVTTEFSDHSPEIDYLINDYNGLILPKSTDSKCYAQKVANVLSDKQFLRKLEKGCHVSAQKYTLNTMVERFSTGIIEALSATPIRYN